MEIVKDGRVVQSVRLDEMAKTGHLPPVTFTESGWVVVRAVTDNAKTYRFASTAPWYVEFGDKPRISKQSAQFFLDWTNERAEKLKLADADQRREVLAFINQSREFWEQRVAEANVD